MKIETLKQEKNPFLQREELILEITSEAAPSASDVISELGRDEALTVVKKINTGFGQQKFITQVVVYDNAEAREKIETIPQKVKKKMEADRKAAEEEAAKKAAAEAEAKKAEEEAAKAEAEQPTSETEGSQQATDKQDEVETSDSETKDEELKE